jgi:ATP-dependent Clp protease ATP-binding subunit ClpX
LREIARIAHEKGTGARGLRAILEHIMLDVMYEVPMKGDVKHCRITKSVVDGRRTALVASDKSLKIA